MIDPILDGTASAQVTGRVRTTARPVADATLTLTDGAGIQVARTRSAADGAEHPVDLAVQTLSTLTGTVTAGGRPLPRLPLTLHDHRGRTVAHTRTDADGTYRFEGVPAGSYTVRSATSGPRAAGIGPDDGVCHLTLAPR